MYDQSNDPEPGWSVDGCVRNWVERGAPKERLNIGLGFYGRSFRAAKGLGAAHGGTDDDAWEIDEGTPQYFVSVCARAHDIRRERTNLPILVVEETTVAILLAARSLFCRVSPNVKKLKGESFSLSLVFFFEIRTSWTRSIE